MAYTLTQARKVLTAAELELFDQSRAQPIRALTEARLRAKVSRARTLRDKYRDLYRRQAVAARTAKGGRGAAGADNERTQRKAEILHEVLGRFEMRLQSLQAREGEPSAAKPAVGKRASTGAAARSPAAPVTVKLAVKRALRIKQATQAPAEPAARSRSAKAPSPRAPTSGASAKAQRATAPVAVVAQAERMNPIKQQAHNIVLHAHAGSQNRRAQGRRDKG